MTKANETQVGGDHYKKLPLEHWDLVTIYQWDYFQAQITRYVMRWRNKNGLEDLEKVVHYSQKYLEVERLRASGNLTIQILLDTLKKLEAEAKKDIADSADDTSFVLAAGDLKGTRDLKGSASCPGFTEPNTKSITGSGFGYD